jgi:excisionase family DNA binding protein
MSIANAMYSPKQVSLALDVSESTVKRWCDRGKINFLRTAGGHRRMRQLDVIEFLRANRQKLVKPEWIGLNSSSQISRWPLQPGVEEAGQASCLAASTQPSHQVCNR